MNRVFPHRAALVRAACGPAVALVVLAAAPAFGAVSDDGIELGRWLLAPYFEADYSADNNVFRQAEDPEDDRISTFTLGLDALLRFRESSFNLSAQTSQVNYHGHQFTRDTDNDFEADLELNFSSGDTLELSQNYTRGFTDVGKLENAELVFEGEPYERLRSDLVLSRAVPRRAGYDLRVSWIQTEFPDQEPCPDPFNCQQYFFDYRGFDSGFEYRQPLPTYKWIVAYYGRRRFDHFRSNSPGAEPFRREESDTIQLGLRGMAGKGQPFVFRVGWGKFNYRFPEDSPEEASGYTGLTAHSSWMLRVGGRTRLRLALDLQPLPSNFSTHFLNTTLSAYLSRPWLRDSEVGVDFRWDNNKYGDPIFVTNCGGWFTRHDQRYGVEAYLDWRLHRRFGYQMAAGYELRDSNCDIYKYTATMVSVGIVAGW